MICFYLSGYTLRQIEGQNVTYVTTPSGHTVKVISGELKNQNVPAIILALGNSSICGTIL